MMSNRKFNPYLLNIARELRTQTQKELSTLANVDQGHLSRIELGIISNPSQEVVQKIADALSFPVDFFYQEDHQPMVNDFFYRKRLTLPAKEKKRLEAQIEIIRIMFDRLVRSVEIPAVKLPTLEVSNNFQPKDIAILTREFFNVQRGPVKNLISLLERHGITVIQLNVESLKFDALTVHTQNNFPLIILNKNMPNDRKRFTLAHELAHQIMHLPFRFDTNLYDRIIQDKDKLEKEADEFASEFLVPTSECRYDLINVNYDKLAQLKLYWSVSKKSLAWKARSVGAITDDKFKTLMIDLSRRGERIKEKEQVPIDQPKLFAEMFKVHFNNLNYTTSEISQILMIQERDYKEFYSNTDSYLRISI